MIGHGLIDEVTGYLNDVNTLVMDLERKSSFITYLIIYFMRCRPLSQDCPGQEINTNTVTLNTRTKNSTIAVSSSAMSRVPVTRRKMIKMLMILSNDLSNHTIICTRTEGRQRRDETQTYRRKKRGEKAREVGE